MKIVLATFGSRGDVQPMLALSLALQAEGHDVLLAAPPEKAAWARRLGCPFRPLGSDVTAFIDNMDNAHTLRSAVRFASFLRRELDTQFDQFPKFIAGADLLIGSSLTFALASLAESMGIAYRFIAFAPQMLPSGHYPFPAFKHQGWPRWSNRITWQVARLLDRPNLTRLINRRRRQLDLKPIRDAWRHVLGSGTVVASDKAIAAVPPDVNPATFVQTGYMHLNQPDRRAPDLQAFLDGGPPPVFAGFGSMPVRDQIRNTALIVRAARLSGQRVVIGKFWDEASRFAHAGDVFFIRRYPHLKLFPRMAAVIHHGGAGTTATTAVSGVPQVVVPHLLDQYYWGNQIYRAGLGPRPIWRSRLSAPRLAAAISECLTNKQIQHKARQTAARIRRQDGVALTVREVLKTRCCVPVIITNTLD